MPWEEYTRQSMRQYEALLATAPDEPTMQHFFEAHPSFLPGADDIGNGGHHGAWWDAVIIQPRLEGLKPNRVPDFMYVRRDTAATRPVCIEIESPSKSWFNKDMTPSAKLTQALDQLDEWDLWFSNIENQMIFNRMYVPPEYNDRQLEPVYVLVYGRDSEFRRNGPHSSGHMRARLKRNKLERPGRHLFTYDMLKPDLAGNIYASIRGDLIGGFSLVALPPTFQTGSHLVFPGSLMDAVDGIADYLQGESWIEPDRRRYLVDRWEFWSTQKNRERNSNMLRTYRTGFE
jgi:hypothetical protein